MNSRKIFGKTFVVYIAMSILCIAFNFIYGFFGHGVVSESMRFAFLYPLIGGVVFYWIFAFIGKYQRIPYNLYNAGIATLTLGSLYNGIIYISGADTSYGNYYFMLGCILIFLAIVIYFIGGKNLD